MKNLLISLTPCLLLALMLAGCGGGGGSSATSGGSVRGVIDAAAFSTGASAQMNVRALNAAAFTADKSVTVGVEGTNITTTALPGQEFVLNNVPPGLQTLVARTAQKAAALVVEVGEKVETNVGALALADAGQITGLVSSATASSPIAGAKVVVSEAVLTTTESDMPHPVRVARTDASGSFTVAGLPAGDYLVTISAPGYDTASLTSTVTALHTSVADVALTPSAPPAGAGTLSGKVYLQATDGTTSPLAGALVVLVSTSDDPVAHPLPATALNDAGEKTGLYTAGGALPPEKEFYAYSGDNGSYSITDIPAGNYHSGAIRPGLKVDRHPVTITAGAVTTQDFTLTLSPPSFVDITGTVTDSATTLPLAGATVCAIFASPVALDATGGNKAGSGVASGAVVLPTRPGAEMGMTATTGADGTYELNAPPAVTAVLVYKEGYQTSTTAAATPVDGKATVNVALTPLASTTGTISGKVTDAVSGAGIAGAQVRITENGSYPYPIETASGQTGATTAIVQRDKATTTGADGTYSLTAPAGMVEVDCSADGYQQASDSVEVTAGNTTGLDIKLTLLPKPATISGTVTDKATGKPIGGALVMLIGPYATLTESADKPDGGYASPIALAARTGDNGTYTVNAPSWVTAIEFSADGYQTETQNVTVTDGATLTEDAQLVALPDLAVITGTVTDADSGKPIVGAVITLTGPVWTLSGAAADKFAAVSATTDSDGHYKIRYQRWATALTASMDGYATFSQTLTPPASGEWVVDVQLKAAAVSGG